MFAVPLQRGFRVRDERLHHEQRVGHRGVHRRQERQVLPVLSRALRGPGLQAGDPTEGRFLQLHPHPSLRLAVQPHPRALLAAPRIASKNATW